MDLEVQEADCWVVGVAVVSEFVAADCQANTVRFSFGELDVADKVGKGFFYIWRWRV